MELTELIIALSRKAVGKGIKQVKMLTYSDDGSIIICNIIEVTENPQMPGVIILECRKTKL